MTSQEIDEILKGYSWIKVKKFVDDPSVPLQLRYDNLLRHHQKETDFLLAKVRELALILKERQDS